MTADPSSPFLDRVLATVAAHRLLPADPGPDAPRETVVLAASGGPDSVALLRALDRLDRNGRLAADLVVAHLHHGLRQGTADADRLFVGNLARRLDRPCETARADVPAEALARRVGIEEAARDARRRFLADVARRRGARTVALGHTRDDRAETVLFHVLRGTGIDGLAALGPQAPLGAPQPHGLLRGRAPDPPRGDARPQADGAAGRETRRAPAPREADPPILIIRPLIDVTRAQVLDFLRALGQDWREDETNASPAHTRNRLRHHLMPALRHEVNPNADEALVRLAEQAAAAREVLDDALDEVWRHVAREPPDGTGVLLDADDFAHLRPWMQGALLRRAVQRLGGGLKAMSMDRTREAADALAAGTLAGPIALPGGLVAQRRRRAIRIGPAPHPGTPDPPHGGPDP